MIRCGGEGQMVRWFEHVKWKDANATVRRCKRMQFLRGRFPVYTQEEVRELNNIALSFEEHIYWSATSQQDYVQKIHLKMLDLTPNFQNPMTNYLYINAANSGQNAHGPEMTMGATSYEYTSGPEESDEKQAAEEDAGDMSKEDVEEEVVVMKEQNYVVGHRENVRVGENEVSCGLSVGAKLDERLV
ncbi:hypothetical protein CQW23_08452 [Capsicum baccatum]|uniref:Mediator complex subunit 15 KIX domain-containing protein n=1 Tax=Capsicum baccatum TaxID=33114 RepID=A0A2G2X938_CAPBA|nr:hypothetical protein CQW23_08452 [Capsicum baccatum]